MSEEEKVEQEEAKKENVTEEKKEETTQFEDAINKLNDTKDTTSEYAKEDVDAGKAMAILSYLSVLVIVPLCSSKSKFARYHVNQGLILFICEVIIYSLYEILPSALTFIPSVLSAVATLLSVLGIVNAANGKAKEVPFIGKIKLIK